MSDFSVDQKEIFSQASGSMRHHMCPQVPPIPVGKRWSLFRPVTYCHVVQTRFIHLVRFSRVPCNDFWLSLGLASSAGSASNSSHNGKVWPEFISKSDQSKVVQFRPGQSAYSSSFQFDPGWLVQPLQFGLGQINWLNQDGLDQINCSSNYHYNFVTFQIFKYKYLIFTFHVY